MPRYCFIVLRYINIYSNITTILLYYESKCNISLQFDIVYFNISHIHIYRNYTEKDLVSYYIYVTLFQSCTNQSCYLMEATFYEVARMIFKRLVEGFRWIWKLIYLPCILCKFHLWKWNSDNATPLNRHGRPTDLHFWLCLLSHN